MQDSGPSVVVNLLLDEEQVAELTGQGTRTCRAALGAAIAHQLPRLVEALIGLGFVGGGELRRHPRRLDSKDWDALRQAAAKTGLTCPDLLRACLRLELEATGGSLAGPEGPQAGHGRTGADRGPTETGDDND